MANRLVFLDIDAALVYYRARWLIERDGLYEILSLNDDMYHYLEKTEAGYVEALSSLTSIFSERTPDAVLQN